MCIRDSFKLSNLQTLKPSHFNFLHNFCKFDIHTKYFPMKLGDLAKELNISTKTLIKFIQDFDLELSECLTTNFDVMEDFVKFARENVNFLKKYEEDLMKQKSVQDIAENINQPTEKVEEIIKTEKPIVYDNGLYLSLIHI